MRHCLLSLMVVVSAAVPLAAQQPGHGDHSHGGLDTAAPAIAPPKVFLDKSPRIVEYQLKRLDNQRLLLVERKSDDKKFIPVYQAILLRVGMSPQFREEAVEALVKLQDSNPVSVLLDAIAKLDGEDREQVRTARQLAAMLLRQPADVLASQTDAMVEAANAETDVMRSIAFAALITSGRTDLAKARLSESNDAKTAFLASVELIPNPAKRSALRGDVVSLLEESTNPEITRAAISALGAIRDGGPETFELVVPFVSEAKFRNAAVKTLLKIPPQQRGAETSADLAGTLVDYAEATPAEARTTPAFIDAMQLADQLLAKLPSVEAKALRQRLGAVTVRVVRIKTVEEEMRYDTPFFAVEAGTSVQIVLENHDLMPHNLVVTVPGALKEVAQLGLQAGPTGGWKGLQYVPESDKVLHATQMVPTDQTVRLTFTAPSEPGEYPYVCTFPQHWYRMYGVMVVVEDLDAWLKNPVEPANPIGSNRSFIQSWTVDDLKDVLEAGLRGRSAEIGEKIFNEASCAGCHKMKGKGGIIGPELSDVLTRWKGDRVAVLREILDPSHKVDAKYAMQKILTVEGNTITGVLIKEDDDNVTLMTNPEATEPTVIPQDDIEAMIPSSVSMMPKALLDQYTKDEIFELMAYLESVNPK